MSVIEGLAHVPKKVVPISNIKHNIDIDIEFHVNLAIDFQKKVPVTYDFCDTSKMTKVSAHLSF